MTGMLRLVLTAALLIALALVAAHVILSLAPHSPNCPPGQWYAEKPGSGWLCAPGSGPLPSVFTPSASPQGGAG